MVWSLQGAPLFCYNYAKKDRKRVLLFSSQRGRNTNTDSKERLQFISRYKRRANLTTRTHIHAGARGTPCTLLKETPKADNPAYHFVVIIFSKHSPGCADKLQSQHSRWAPTLSLPSLLPWNSIFFHSVRLLPHSVSSGRMTGRRRTGGGGERKTRWHSGVKVMTLNVR